MKGFLYFECAIYGASILIAASICYPDKLRAAYRWLTFRKLCNWNRAHKRDKTTYGNPFLPKRFISHGICPECREIVMRENKLGKYR